VYRLVVLEIDSYFTDSESNDDDDKEDPHTGVSPYPLATRTSSIIRWYEWAILISTAKPSGTLIPTPLSDGTTKTTSSSSSNTHTSLIRAHPPKPLPLQPVSLLPQNTTHTSLPGNHKDAEGWFIPPASYVEWKKRFEETTVQESSEDDLDENGSGTESRGGGSKKREVELPG